MNGFSKKNQNYLSPHPSKGKKQRKNAVSVIMLSSVFLVSLFAVGWNAEWFYQAAYEAEGLLQRSVKQISGVAAQPNQWNGKPRKSLSCRNLADGTSYEPSAYRDSLPSRLFPAGTYLNGTWQRADEEAVFAQMEENTLHWDQWSDWIPNMFDSMYYAMNSLMLREEPLPDRELWMPAASKHMGSMVYSPMSADGTAGEWKNKTSSVQTATAMNITKSEKLTLIGKMSHRILRETGTGILSFRRPTIKKQRTHILMFPRRICPRLVSLCEGESGGELRRNYRHDSLPFADQHGLYTREPGLFPMNEDPVEYFLFEGQEGYCQHFASAAT